MMNDLIPFTQALAHYALLLTFQLILILMVRKPVLQIFGAVYTYRLWLLPAMWAPLYFIDWSWIYPDVVRTWTANTTVWAPVNLISPALEWLPENLSGPVPATLDDSAGMVRAARGINWQALLAGLWLAGVLMLLICQGLAFLLFSGYLSKHAMPVPVRERQVIVNNSALGTRVSLYTLPGLRTPALFGVIKPVLLLPEDFMSAYDSDQRRLILSHEAVHLRRRDILWNLFAWGCKAVFWFNPLAHLAYRYYRADQELSCDALALTQSNVVQRRRYAKTLLESFGKPGTYHQSPLLTAWNNLHTIKERTAMIKKYSQCKSRPLLFRVSLLSLLLTGAAITALMTDTLSPPTLAAEAAQTPSIPVDRTALSAAVADAADRTADLIGERDYSAAEVTLNNLRTMALAGDLNAQERFLFWHLTGDLERAKRNTSAAVDAYTAMLDIPELSRAQREEALLQSAGAYLASGPYTANYKAALALYQELAAMSGNSNPDHLIKIAETLQRLKQRDNALTAAREAFDAYGDDAPRSAYELLWRLTPDNVSKRRIHETQVEKFRDAQDIARLALFTREDGSYDPNVLGGCLILAIGGNSPAGGTCDGNGSGPIQLQSAAVTPDNIHFRPSAQPLAFVRPVYPEEARLNGKEGMNLVVLDLDENGDVSSAVIMMSNPDRAFDDATLTAITQFRFDLTQIESNADDLDLVYAIRYQLP